MINKIDYGVYFYWGSLTKKMEEPHKKRKIKNHKLFQKNEDVLLTFVMIPTQVKWYHSSHESQQIILVSSVLLQIQ